MQLAPSRTRPLVLAVLLALVAVLAAAAPGSAQTSSTSTSTSTSSTTEPTDPTVPSTVTVPGETTTTTEQPDDEVPERDIDPDDDPGHDETGAPEPPPDDEVVIPAPEPAPTSTGVDRLVRHALVAEVERARRTAGEVETALGEVVAAVEDASTRQRRLVGDIERMRLQERRLAARVAEVTEDVAVRARIAYVSGPSALQSLLDARGPNELLRRAALAASVLEADLDGAARARDDHAAAARSLEEMLIGLPLVRSDLARAADDAAVLRLEASRAREVLAMFEAGSAIAVSGFVFPVGDPHSFGDTFGAPRMPGTEYEHRHQGTDIFAPVDTPLYAVERGVVARVGTDVLGGTKLWLIGASGTRYYYAHLSTYAEGVAEGLVVERGAVLGFVGNTGNARTTPPHLHFEIHPQGLGPVNPYPILAVTDRYSGDADVETA